MDHALARWQFKQAVKLELVRDTDLKSLNYKDSKQSDNLLRELVDLLYDVTTQSIIGMQNATDVGNVIDTKLASYNNTAESRQTIVSVFNSLPGTIEAYRVKSTYEVLSGITMTAKRQADEIMLLGMITGKCRVCRRLSR